MADKPADDDPVPLRDAPALFWPMGGMTVAKLRKQAQRGFLAVEKIGRTEFVTASAIREMRELCRVGNPRPALPSERKPTDAASGSSEKDNDIDAQTALRVRLSKPSKPLATSSREAGGPTRRNVVHLSSSSPQS
jgi:hypothetical protein